jgi:hypothetical protein
MFFGIFPKYRSPFLVTDPTSISISICLRHHDNISSQRMSQRMEMEMEMEMEVGFLPCSDT